MFTSEAGGLAGQRAKGTLEAQVAAVFLAVNGRAPMTAEDDRYVDEYFVPLEEVCTKREESSDQIREHMLAARLPIPSYLKSDGTEMVPGDLLRLADEAGGPRLLRTWFLRQRWATPAQAAEEWEAYLTGQYVCLRSVTPKNIRRKGELVEAIESAVSSPRPHSPEWLKRLHSLVDELDALEPPFTGYDRLRFGGPTSRDTCIDEPRARYPRPSAPLDAA